MITYEKALETAKYFRNDITQVYSLYSTWINVEHISSK